MIAYRVFSAFPNAAFAYLVVRTTPLAIASTILVAVSAIPIFQLLDFGEVTAASEMLSKPDFGTDSMLVAVRLMRIQSILLVFGLSAVALLRMLGLASKFQLQGSFLAVVFVSCSISTAAAVFERRLVMRRKYGQLVLCAAPSCLLIVLCLLANLLFSVRFSLFALGSILGCSIFLPRLLAIFTEVHPVRLLRVAFSGSWNAPKTRRLSKAAARGFLALQVIGLVSFQTDVVVAKLIGSDSSAVRLALLGRAFGPVLLVGSALAQDIWPRILSDCASTDAARRMCIRVLLVTGVLSVGAAGIAQVLNLSLPVRSQLGWSDLAAGILWFPMLSFGTAIGQVLAARGQIRLLVRRGWAMAGSNLLLTIVFGHLYGPPGFLLASFVSYGVLIVGPSWHLTGENGQ